MSDGAADEGRAVGAYLAELHERLTSAFEAADGGARCAETAWERPEGGGGRARLLRDGAVFEQVGINIAEVHGAALPAAATARRPQLAGPAASRRAASRWWPIRATRTSRPRTSTCAS